jgi:hypothetical protein
MASSGHSTAPLKGVNREMEKVYVRIYMLVNSIENEWMSSESKTVESTVYI